MILENWSFVISIKDLINFKRFKSDIKHQMELRDSKFNKYKLKVNWLGNVIYYQMNCTEEELQQFNYLPDAMVFYKMKPIVEYMNELGWSEYLIPQVNNFVDEDGTVSLSYGITLLFTPFKFRLYKLLTWPIIASGLIVGIIELIKYLPF